MNKEQFIKQRVSAMSIEEKVGQCFVIGYVGATVTPEIIRRIKTYKPAGIRAGLMWRIRTVKHDPNGTNTDFASRLQRPYKGTIKDFLPDIPVPHFTNEEFCEYVNTLKQAAIENGNVPLHFTFDFEGDVSADYYRGGVKYFPSCMGIAHGGDKALAKDVAWAVGRQLAPLGFSMVHSPVLDVNTNPKNPEIGTRSYAQDPDTVAEYAVEAIKGFKEAGIIATGKHFPGRGESAADAHHGLPVIDISKEELYEKHIKPYKKLIEAGLPAVMTAHTAYPALDDSGLPATLSKKIVTGILKEELGFKGVVTTDEITMGGIISEFEVKDACLEAINAGCDLVLLRDEGGLIDEVIPALVEAVKDGRLSEERLDDAVTRTLGVKYDYGFFENEQIRDVAKASEGINDAKVKEIAMRSAKKAMNVIRDENNILPLKEGTKALFVYQVNPVHERTNTQSCNPATPWLEMLKYSDDVYCVEAKMKYPEEDRQRVYERIDEADVIIVTNYFDRRNPDSGNSFVKELHEKTDKPIIVVTNSPYQFTVLDEYKTAICTYSSSVESFKELANVIFKGDGNVR